MIGLITYLSLINNELVYTNSNKSIVRIESYKGIINVGHCTGTYIDSEGTVLTSDHCVDDPDLDFYIRNYKGDFYKYDIIKRSKDKSVAYIKPKDIKPTLNHLEVDFLHKYKMGESVSTIGFPFDYPISIKTGIITTNYKNDLIFCQMDVYGGMSGAPLISRDNKVIGVLYGARINHNSISLFHSVNFVKRLFDEK